jgi:hypothetical protein
VEALGKGFGIEMGVSVNLPNNMVVYSSQGISLVPMSLISKLMALGG